MAKQRYTFHNAGTDTADDIDPNLVRLSETLNIDERGKVWHHLFV